MKEVQIIILVYHFIILSILFFGLYKSVKEKKCFNTRFFIIICFIEIWFLTLSLKIPEFGK